MKEKKQKEILSLNLHRFTLERMTMTLILVHRFKKEFQFRTWLQLIILWELCRRRMFYGCCHNGRNKAQPNFRSHQRKEIQSVVEFCKVSLRRILLELKIKKEQKSQYNFLKMLIKGLMIDTIIILYLILYLILLNK